MGICQIHSLMIVTCFIFTYGEATLLGDQRVDIVELSVPRYPKAGDDVVLQCHFRLGGLRGGRLYTVNWWRGKDQFFTFKKSNEEPKQVFTVRGLDVVITNSTAERVVLRGVSEESSGLYRCEVIGEGPAFRTDVESKRMNVIVPPERVEISEKGERRPLHYYKVDDLITLNCTAHKVKPRPLIVWRINGIEVKRTEIRRYTDKIDENGRFTSTLGLQFLAARYFINRRALVSCLVEVKGHQFFKEEELTLKPSAAFDLYSSGGWRKSICWQILSFLILITNSSSH